ncbi:MAG: hypothetical protein WCL37_00915 [Chrysiogenales bacterium]
MKGLQQVTSGRDVKSIRSVGARSIPKIQRSPYLELYTHKREKDRLEKEIFALDKRSGTVRRLLDAINKRIEKLQAEAREEQETATFKHAPAKPLKTLAIKY